MLTTNWDLEETPESRRLFGQECDHLNSVFKVEQMLRNPPDFETFNDFDPRNPALLPAMLADIRRILSTHAGRSNVNEATLGRIDYELRQALGAPYFPWLRFYTERTPTGDGIQVRPMNLPSRVLFAGEETMRSAGITLQTLNYFFPTPQSAATVKLIEAGYWRFEWSPVERCFTATCTTENDDAPIRAVWETTAETWVPGQSR
jgi:hypothetical protein